MKQEALQEQMLLVFSLLPAYLPTSKIVKYSTHRCMCMSCSPALFRYLGPVVADFWTVSSCIPCRGAETIESTALGQGRSCTAKKGLASVNHEQSCFSVGGRSTVTSLSAHGVISWETAFSCLYISCFSNGNKWTGPTLHSFFPLHLTGSTVKHGDST